MTGKIRLFDLPRIPQKEKGTLTSANYTRLQNEKREVSDQISSPPVPTAGQDDNNVAPISLALGAQRSPEYSPLRLGFALASTFASIPVLLDKLLPSENRSRPKLAALSSNPLGSKALTELSTETDSEPSLGRGPSLNSIEGTRYRSVGHAIMRMHYHWVSINSVGGSGLELWRRGFATSLPFQTAEPTVLVDKNIRLEHSSAAPTSQEHRISAVLERQHSRESAPHQFGVMQANRPALVRSLPSGSFSLGQAAAIAASAFATPSKGAPSLSRTVTGSSPVPPVAAGPFLRQSARLVSTLADLETSETKLRFASMNSPPFTVPRVDLPKIKETVGEIRDIIDFEESAKDLTESARDFAAWAKGKVRRPKEPELPTPQLPSITSFPADDSEFLSLSDSNNLRLKIARILEEEARRYLPDE